jgi:hypothetical protein
MLTSLILPEAIRSLFGSSISDGSLSLTDRHGFPVKELTANTSLPNIILNKVDTNFWSAFLPIGMFSRIARFNSSKTVPYLHSQKKNSPMRNVKTYINLNKNYLIETSIRKDFI